MSDTTTQMPGSRTKQGGEKTSFAHEAAHKASDMAENAADKADAALEKGKQLAEVAGVQAKEASQVENRVFEVSFDLCLHRVTYETFRVCERHKGWR